jgi:hypothetical protein
MKNSVILFFSDRMHYEPRRRIQPQRLSSINWIQVPIGFSGLKELAIYISHHEFCFISRVNFLCDEKKTYFLLCTLPRAGPDILGALSENQYGSPIRKFDSAIFLNMISEK